MWRARRSISLLLLLTTPWLSGCHSTHAQPTPSRSSAAKAQSPAAPASKHPPRDSALSVYNNPTYGVSFRYPRNYLLDDQPDSEDPSILLAQRELAEQQPGAILVATVTIPPDAYPNTTFRSATLHLVIHPGLTLETCQSFAAPMDAADTPGATPAQGLIFHWRQAASAAAGTAFLDRDYSAFSAGTCYEFHLQVVTASNPDADPSIKPADDSKIIRHLDKIVSSLQFHSSTSSLRPL